MDALLVILKFSRLGFASLLMVYGIAAWVVLAYLASWVLAMTMTIMLVLAFLFELRVKGIFGRKRVSAVRWVEGRWSIMQAGSWQEVEISACNKALPFCLVVKAKSWPAGKQCFYIWQDSMPSAQWRLLSSYLAVC